MTTSGLRGDVPVCRVLPTDTPARFRAAVRAAATLLRAGELVALPTETVYGLAANALDARAVARIFAAKQRPADNPIIVHVSGVEMARRCVREWPLLAQRLAAAFWPGPLTMVLPRSRTIPRIVTAGGPTVAVRWPSHPVMQAVIEACGFPLAAPSANVSTRLSPTSAEHVLQGLEGRIRLILDGGLARVGIESTVLDLTVSPPRILRLGMIHAEALRAVAEPCQGPAPGTRRPKRLRSPGQLPKHYAPRARLCVWSWENERELRARLKLAGWRTHDCHLLVHARITAGRGFAGVSVMPHAPAAYAKALYAELHRCDHAGAKRIIVEAVPRTVPWAAIADRLRRAAG